MLSRPSHPPVRPLLLAFLLALFCSSVSAQFSSGIEGTVRDPSGAMVAGADVVIANENLGVKRDTKTNDSGFFRVTELAPGTYRVEIRFSGFKQWVQTSLPVAAREVRTISAQLEVGETTTSVDVKADVVGVSLAQSDTRTDLSERTVRDMALVGRNIYSLAALAPGIMGVADQGGGRGGVVGRDNYDNEFGLSINAAGQRQESNVFLVDGSYVTSSSRGGVVHVAPNPDTVEEISVAANTFTAEKGRNSGAMIEVVTKSGTNDWHGTFAWFHINNHLAARTVFQTAKPRAIPVFQRNEASATIGGPIVPNRTFVFGSFTVLRSAVAQTSINTVETPQFRGWLKTNRPNSIALKALELAPPATDPTVDFLSVAQVKSRFPGYFPAPSNIPDDLPAIGSATITQTTFRNAEQWNVRVDHHFGNQKDRIYGNAYRTTAQSLSPDIRPAFRFTVPNKTMWAKANWTRVFSSAVVNEVGFSYTRPEGENSPVDAFGIPSISITGTSGFGGWGPGNFITNTYEWRDYLMWNRGNHSLKFGAEQQLNWEFADQTSAANRPSFSFNNLLDFAQDLPTTQSGPRINLIRNKPAPLIIHHNIRYSGFFVHDNWKVTPRFTLNLGLRYDDYGKLARYIPEPDPPSFWVPGSGSTFAERVTNGKVGIRGEGDKLLTTARLNGFAPRFGFAWDVFGSGRTSLRGGYGIFYDRIPNLWYTEPLRNNLPFVFQPSWDVRQGSTLSYGLGTVNGLEVTYPPPPGLTVQFDSRGGLVGVRSSAGGFDWQPSTPASHNWMLSVQHRLTGNLIAELNYSGSSGVHLPIRTDINRFPGDLIVNNGRRLRLNQSFGGITYSTANGNSFGNFFSTVLNKRFSNRWSMRGIYTFGKVLDYYSTSNTGVSGTPIVDVFNIRQQRGRADFDSRQRLSIDSVFNLPNFWKNGWQAQVFGNWRIAGIAILQTGRPFTVYSSAPYPRGDFNADGNNYDFPNTPAFGNSIGGKTEQQYLKGLFAAADFPRPSPGTQGSLGRNTFTNPGYANLDFNFVKVVKVPWFTREGANAELRGEIFNLFNRVNLGGVNGNLDSTTFGRVTSTLGARAVQFGARIEY